VHNFLEQVLFKIRARREFTFHEIILIYNLDKNYKSL